MVIEKVIGNLRDIGDLQDENTAKPDFDYVYMDAADLGRSHRRIKSASGIPVCISLENGARLHDGDILYRDKKKMIVIVQSEEDALVIPRDFTGDALAGYTIGNIHAPIFISDEYIATPFDPAVENALKRAGISCEKKLVKLCGNKIGSHSHGGSAYD